MFSQKNAIFRVLIAIGLLCAADGCPVFGAGWKMLSGHVPPGTGRLTAIGNLPKTNELSLAIGLPLRDEAGLDAFLADVYNPASPNYRHFLTPEEFATRFGPTEKDYASVQSFARTNGFTIKTTYPNRLLLSVQARVGDIQRAFHIKLERFKHPNESRVFFAPDTEPMVDAALPVADVSGLSDYSRPHPKMIQMSAPAMLPKGGSAPNGISYLGQDIRNAYVPGTALDGSGQMVGLLEFDGFNSNAIVNYENLLPGQPNVPLTTSLLDGFTGAAGSRNSEVCLDIELAIGMAPGLSRVVVFEGKLPNSILNAMAASNTVKNLSCSWGWSGGPITTTENIFKNMAAQGQSFFNASGDSDAYLSGAVDNPNYTNYPSGSANISQVGGTVLTMNGSGGAYVSETVWNSGDGSGSSGGISSSNSLPVWQQGIDMTANGGSTAFRNLPDVALTASQLYVIYNTNSGATVGGTSCAAPLWAGFTALVNQQAAATGNAPVGFVNPAIYTLAKGPNYHFYFHDITTGSNTWSASPASFFAVPGFDLCTGWGTPAGTNLINALAMPDPLWVAPLAGFNSTGPVGGPFSVATQTLMLTNTGSLAVNWAMGSSAAWLAVTPSAGTLSAGAETNVAVSLTPVATTLTAARYSGSANLTNLSSGLMQSIPFDLQIGQTLVANGGFETGDLTGWTLANNSSYDGVQSGSVLTPHSGAYCFGFGNPSVLSSLSQNLVTLPGQNYLVSFWLSDPYGGSPEQFGVNWNTNSTTANTIYTMLNPAGFVWTNLTFVVAATSTNTVLQFEGENNAYYFGLDDVSVLPIPMPSFTSFTAENNSFAFSWISLPGVSYQVQYATNLSGANWLILGTNLATTGTTSFTNINNGTPQCFYRIRRLP